MINERRNLNTTQTQMIPVLANLDHVEENTKNDTPILIPILTLTPTDIVTIATENNLNQMIITINVDIIEQNRGVHLHDQDPAPVPIHVIIIVTTV
jgi:hypothetical protein